MVVDWGSCGLAVGWGQLWLGCHQKARASAVLAPWCCTAHADLLADPCWLLFFPTSSDPPSLSFSLPAPD